MFNVKSEGESQSSSTHLFPHESPLSTAPAPLLSKHQLPLGWVQATFSLAFSVNRDQAMLSCLPQGLRSAPVQENLS